MNAGRPSLARRALAALVLVVVVIVAIRIVLGVISAVFWIVALVALVLAALWAISTLKSGTRERRVKRESSPGQVRPASPDDRVEAQMREIEQQLREQGRR